MSLWAGLESRNYTTGLTIFVGILLGIGGLLYMKISEE